LIDRPVKTGETGHEEPFGIAAEHVAPIEGAVPRPPKGDMAGPGDEDTTVDSTLTYKSQSLTSEAERILVDSDMASLKLIPRNHDEISLAIPK
jgi:hypothetical protein